MQSEKTPRIGMPQRWRGRSCGVSEYDSRAQQSLLEGLRDQATVQKSNSVDQKRLGCVNGRKTG